MSWSGSKGGQKRSKAFYKKSVKKRKGCEHGVLEAGMKGFLLTCNHDEKRCVIEGYKVLSQYADEMYGPEEVPASATNSDGESGSDDDDDIETALKKETENLKDLGKKKERRFQARFSGANNVVFIKTLVESPTDLVYKIFSDVAKKKQNVARYIHRLIPVEGTCKARTENIVEMAEKLIHPHFHAEGVPAKSFCVVYKARSNSEINRIQIVDAVAKIVLSKNGHWVDLDGPELAIMVEVIKTVCCLSIVKEYKELCKYNLQVVVEGQKDPSELAVKRTPEDVKKTDSEKCGEQTDDSAKQQTVAMAVNIKKEDTGSPQHQSDTDSNVVSIGRQHEISGKQEAETKADSEDSKDGTENKDTEVNDVAKEEKLKV